MTLDTIFSVVLPREVSIAPTTPIDVVHHLQLRVVIVVY